MESKIVLCFLCLQLVAAVSGYATVYYIDDHCGSTLTVSSAIRLKLLSYSWPSSRTCTVTITSSSIYHSDYNTRMLVKFNKINLSKGIGCSKSEVDIYDYDGTQLNTGGSCGYSLPFFQPWKSTSNSMSVKLVKKTSLALSGSFDILITQFSTGFCSSGEYECFNGRCIDDLLTCDGYDNCGDNSDETDGCGYSWSVGTTAGVSVVGIVVFVFFILVFAAVYRRRTYGRVFWGTSPYQRSGGATVVSTTSSAVTNYPPPPTQCPPPAYAPPPAYPNSGYPNPGFN